MILSETFLRMWKFQNLKSQKEKLLLAAEDENIYKTIKNKFKIRNYIAAKSELVITVSGTN